MMKRGNNCQTGGAGLKRKRDEMSKGAASHSKSPQTHAFHNSHIHRCTSHTSHSPNIEANTTNSSWTCTPYTHWQHKRIRRLVIVCGTVLIIIRLQVTSTQIPAGQPLLIAVQISKIQLPLCRFAWLFVFDKVFALSKAIVACVDCIVFCLRVCERVLLVVGLENIPGTACFVPFLANQISDCLLLLLLCSFRTEVTQNNYRQQQLAAQVDQLSQEKFELEASEYHRLEVRLPSCLYGYGVNGQRLIKRQ